MNKDPNLQEMVKELDQFAKDNEIAAIEIAEGIHNFAVDFHTGQNSNLYAVTSAQGFRPGMAGVMSENGKLVYDELVARFMGYRPSVLAAWNGQQRAARALLAIRAYAKAKGEEPDETDLQDLLTDMLHLMKVADKTQEDMGTMMRLAVENFTEEVDEADGNFQVDKVEHDRLDQEEIFHIGGILPEDFQPVQNGAWKV